MVDLLQDPRVASTVSFKHIRDGYWASFPTANPKHRVPLQHDLSLPLVSLKHPSFRFLIAAAAASCSSCMSTQREQMVSSR